MGPKSRALRHGSPDSQRARSLYGRRKPVRISPDADQFTRSTDLSATFVALAFTCLFTRNRHPLDLLDIRRNHLAGPWLGGHSLGTTHVWPGPARAGHLFVFTRYALGCDLRRATF